MRIEIHNAEQAEIGPLTKAIERACQYCQYSQCFADHIEIAVSPRGSTCSNPRLARIRYQHHQEQFHVDLHRNDSADIDSRIRIPLLEELYSA